MTENLYIREEWDDGALILHIGTLDEHAHEISYFGYCESQADYFNSPLFYDMYIMQNGELKTVRGGWRYDWSTGDYKALEGIPALAVGHYSPEEARERLSSPHPFARRNEHEPSRITLYNSLRIAYIYPEKPMTLEDVHAYARHIAPHERLQVMAVRDYLQGTPEGEAFTPAWCEKRHPGTQVIINRLNP